MIKAFIFPILLAQSLNLYSETIAPIKLATDEWYPFSSKKLPGNGVMIKALVAAFKESGVDVDIKFYPTSRILKLVEDGDAEITAGWSTSEEREKHYHFTDTMFHDDCVLFSLKSNKVDYVDFESVRHLRIGGTGNSFYGEDVVKAEAAGTFKIRRVPEDRLNFFKLLEGRIDAFPLNKFVGLSMMDRELTPEQAAKITYAEKPFITSELLILVSKKSPRGEQIVKWFNDGLKKLKASGELDRLFNEAGKPLESY